ncbi:MAG: hypothetical protein WDN28_01560 [Chthoniobacter sp.]
MEPDPAGPHLIEFFDGRLLHGTLESVDLARREITWRRPDASAPLTIPIVQISRLSFVPLPAPQNPFVEIDIPRRDPPAADPKDKKIHATVKFVGGDWLAAEVTNIQDNKIHLQMSDGSPLTVDRAQVDWIYFSKGAAPECYDGPTSLAGWLGGGWVYRDGALRASSPAKLERNFASLPDQVEYSFVADQGNLMCAFNLNLHGRAGQGWSGEPGVIQCMLRASTLTVMSNSEGRTKNEQVDLTKIFGDSLDGRGKPGKNNPVRMRVLEDFTGGRLAIFINDRKAGEWTLQKGESGRNRGSFVFQPTIWNSNSEQTLSQIRVVPWDGRIPADAEKGAEAADDRLALTDGTARDGKFIDLVSRTARLRTGGATFETPRDRVKMLHFAHQDGPAAAPPEVVARVHLVQGGEFDAAGLVWRDGKLLVRARFGSEFPLPVTAVAELSFLQTPPTLSTAEDVLVFENGDRLKGKLELAEENQKVRWRTDEAAQPVEFDPAHVAGVRGGWSDHPSQGRIDSVVRFRNGDWLAGRFLTLDKDQLVLDTPDAGQLTITRALVRTLYFSADGTLPISDGAADDSEWLHGPEQFNNPGSPSAVRPAAARGANPWKSFDGAFSLLTTGAGETIGASIGGVHIGRQLASLPALVEASFDVTAQRGQILFSAQLFTEAGHGRLCHANAQPGAVSLRLEPGDARTRGIDPAAGAVRRKIEARGEAAARPVIRQSRLGAIDGRDRRCGGHPFWRKAGYAPAAVGPRPDHHPPGESALHFFQYLVRAVEWPGAGQDPAE